MNNRRYFHTASLLINEKVLVTGGSGYDENTYWGSKNSSELYDPLTEIWTKTANMNNARDSHTASLLINGKVLVSGGYFTDGKGFWESLNSSELYDPATGMWTKTDIMSDGRQYHTASVLTSGKVLVSGGVDSYLRFLSSSELYDPATGKWTKTGNMSGGRQYHTASVLTSGKVLVTGGYNSNGTMISAELYQYQ
ncbi:unnamed protein product [Rotaria sp. Silwood1]|nr:unnamed protein product [Rotaria sp. Silwood1]CAF5029413.1 unnamed protein product [Rotaria sp. Silwood1]